MKKRFLLLTILSIMFLMSVVGLFACSSTGNVVPSDNTETNKQVQEDYSVSQQICADAINTTKENGVVADFVYSYDDSVNYDGLLQMTFGDKNCIKIDTTYDSKPASFYISLDEEKSGSLYLTYGTFNTCFNFENLNDFIDKFVNAFSINANSTVIKIIARLFDLNSCLESINNLPGTLMEDGSYLYNPNLVMFGVPINLPLKMIVKDNVITYFGTENGNLFGNAIKFVLTNSTKEKDIDRVESNPNATDLTEALEEYSQNNPIIEKAKAICNNKQVSFNIDFISDNTSITGDADIDFTNSECCNLSANLLIDNEQSLSIIYKDGYFYIKVGDVGIYADIQTINDYASLLSEFSITDFVDLSSATGTADSNNTFLENVLSSISDMIYGKEQIDFKLGIFYVTITSNNIQLSLGTDTCCLLYNICDTANIDDPVGNYSDMAGLDNIFGKINNLFASNTYYFTGALEFGEFSIALNEVSIINNGTSRNPIRAFKNGELSINVKATFSADKKIRALELTLFNNALYINYNNVSKFKLSKISFEDIVDLLKTNYNKVVEKLHYLSILPQIETSADDSLSLILPAEETEERSKVEVTISNIVSIFKSIISKNGQLGITIDPSKFGLDVDATIALYINKDGKLSLDVNYGNKNGNLVLNEETPEDITVEECEYIDFSSIKEVLVGVINTILNETGTYYFDGNISARLEKGGASYTINYSFSLAIRTIDKEDYGKVAELVAIINTNDTIKYPATNYLRPGTGWLVYKDNKVYIERRNDPVWSWQDDAYYSRSMTADYFSQYASQQLGFFLGLQEDVTDNFGTTGSGNSLLGNKEKVIKTYTSDNGVQTFVINGKAISNAGDISDSTATITIKDDQLLTISGYIPIEVSVFDLKTNFTFNQVFNKTDIDFSYLNNLNPSRYGFVG